jgi:hypothetical protein
MDGLSPSWGQVLLPVLRVRPARAGMAAELMDIPKKQKYVQ